MNKPKNNLIRQEGKRGPDVSYKKKLIPSPLLDVQLHPGGSFCGTSSCNSMKVYLRVKSAGAASPHSEKSGSGKMVTIIQQIIKKKKYSGAHSRVAALITKFSKKKKTDVMTGRVTNTNELKRTK